MAAVALMVMLVLTAPRSMPSQQDLHVLDRVDRDANPPHLAGRHRVRRCRSPSGSAGRRRPRGRSGRDPAGSGSGGSSPRPSRSLRTGASSTAGRDSRSAWMPRVNGIGTRLTELGRAGRNRPGRPARRPARSRCPRWTDAAGAGFGSAWLTRPIVPAGPVPAASVEAQQEDAGGHRCAGADGHRARCVPPAAPGPRSASSWPRW